MTCSPSKKAHKMKALHMDKGGVVPEGSKGIPPAELEKIREASKVRERTSYPTDQKGKYVVPQDMKPTGLRR